MSWSAVIRKMFVAGGWAPLSVFAVHVVLSRVVNAYARFPPTDIPMHFMGGLAMAFFVSCCFQALPRDVLRSSRVVVLELVLVGSLTATSAMLWEFAEFTCDSILGTNVQRGLSNTMQDMALGLAGAAVFIALRAKALRAGRAELRAVANEWITGQAA